MIRNRSIVAIVFILACTSANAAWRAADTTAENKYPLAYVVNDAGEKTELYVDADTIYLRLNLSNGFESFPQSNCPTFQIDQRTPLHHFEIGPTCVVEDKRATYTLGKLKQRQIKSLILHRIMNGNVLIFRYTIKNGQYREARFSLSRSKAAFKTALGYNPTIEVD